MGTSPIFLHLCIMSSQFPLITILGPTAAGKTSFAVQLAHSLRGEIISADSRQVFRGMDIGTGKDLEEYRINDVVIPAHLIDIADAGSEYNVFRFRRDFDKAYSDVIARGSTPVLCGGTGMYLEAVLLGYSLEEVPQNEKLRLEMDLLSDNELTAKLSTLRQLHNTTDSLDRERLLRAIEIEVHKLAKPEIPPVHEFTNTPVFGLRFERSVLRNRITARLTQRLENGMIDEVAQLLHNGVSKERLIFYGLEYKYLCLHLSGEISYSSMFGLLNTAIHQFAKRQMTWFRRMESKGIKIFWLDGEDGLSVNLAKARTYLDSF